MKKLPVLLFAILLVFSAGCGGKNTPTTSTAAPTEPALPTQDSGYPAPALPERVMPLLPGYPVDGTSGDGTENGNGSDSLLPNPPGVTLTISEQAQIGELGSYCWPVEGGRGALCADSLGLPTNATPITTKPKFTAAFDFPPDGEPSSVTLHISNVKDIVELNAEENVRWWQPGEGVSYTSDGDRQVRFDLNLAPGEYVLMVFGKWGESDASYGFLIQVTE